MVAPLLSVHRLKLRFFFAAHSWVIACFFSALVAGCGGSADYPHATIEGTVTLDGKPIKEGTITFFPAGSASGSGGSADIVNGKYRLTEVPRGNVFFTFSASERTGKTIPGPGGDPEPEWVNIMPERYRTEGIERKIVEAGTQDFALENQTE